MTRKHICHYMYLFFTFWLFTNLYFNVSQKHNFMFLHVILY